MSKHAAAWAATGRAAGAGRWGRVSWGLTRWSVLPRLAMVPARTESTAAEEGGVSAEEAAAGAPEGDTAPSRWDSLYEYGEKLQKQKGQELSEKDEEAMMDEFSSLAKSRFSDFAGPYEESLLDIERSVQADQHELMNEALENRPKRVFVRNPVLAKDVRLMAKHVAKAEAHQRDINEVVDDQLESEHQAHVLWTTAQYANQHYELAIDGIEAPPHVRPPEMNDEMWRAYKEDGWPLAKIAQFFGVNKKKVEAQLRLKEEEERQRAGASAGESVLDDDSVSHLLESIHGYTLPAGVEPHGYNVSGRHGPKYTQVLAPDGMRLFPWQHEELRQHDEKRRKLEEQYKASSKRVQRQLEPKLAELDAQRTANLEEWREQETEIEFEVCHGEKPEPCAVYTVHRLAVTEGATSDDEDFSHFLDSGRLLMRDREFRHQLFEQSQDNCGGFDLVDRERPEKMVGVHGRLEPAMESESDDEAESTGPALAGNPEMGSVVDADGNLDPRYQPALDETAAKLQGVVDDWMEEEDLDNEEKANAGHLKRSISHDPYQRTHAPLEDFGGDISDAETGDKIAQARGVQPPPDPEVVHAGGPVTEEQQANAARWLEEEGVELGPDEPSAENWPADAGDGEYPLGLEPNEDFAEGRRVVDEYESDGSRSALVRGVGDEEFSDAQLATIRGVEAGQISAEGHEELMARRRKLVRERDAEMYRAAEQEFYHKHLLQLGYVSEKELDPTKDYAAVMNEVAANEDSSMFSEESGNEDAESYVEARVPWQQTMWFEQSAFGEWAEAHQRNELIRLRRERRARRDGDDDPVALPTDLEEESEEESEITARILARSPDFDPAVYDYLTREGLTDVAFTSRLAEYDGRTILNQRRGDPLYTFIDEGVDQRALGVSYIPPARRGQGNLPETPLDPEMGVVKKLRNAYKELGKTRKRKKTRPDVLLMDTSKPAESGAMYIMKPDGETRTATWEERRAEHFKPVPQTKRMPADDPKVDRMYFPSDEHEQRLMYVQEIERLEREGGSEARIAELKGKLEDKDPGLPRLPRDPTMNTGQFLAQLAIMAGEAQEEARERVRSGDADGEDAGVAVAEEMVAFRALARDLLQYIGNTQNAVPLYFRDVVGAYKLAGLKLESIERDARMSLEELAERLGVQSPAEYHSVMQATPNLHRRMSAMQGEFEERAREDPLLRDGVDRMKEFELDRNFTVEHPKARIRYGTTFDNENADGEGASDSQTDDE